MSKINFTPVELVSLIVVACVITGSCFYIF